MKVYTSALEGKDRLEEGGGHVTSPCHRVMLRNEGRRMERRKAEAMSHICIQMTTLMLKQLITKESMTMRAK